MDTKTEETETETETETEETETETKTESRFIVLKKQLRYLLKVFLNIYLQKKIKIVLKKLL